MKKYFINLLFLSILLTLLSCETSGQIKLKKVDKFNTGIAYGLRIKDDLAYTTTNKSLIILDAQNPEKLKKVSELEIGSPIFSLVLEGNYAYLAASDKGLIIVDISDSKNPQVVGQYTGDGDVGEIEIMNNYLLLFLKV